MNSYDIEKIVKYNLSKFKVKYNSVKIDDEYNVNINIRDYKHNLKGFIVSLRKKNIVLKSSTYGNWKFKLLD